MGVLARIVIILLPILFHLNPAYCQEEVENTATESQASMSLEEQISNLGELPSADQLQNYYVETSRLWAEVANKLKRDISDPPEILEEEGEKHEQELSLWEKTVAQDFTLLKKASRKRAEAFKKLQERGEFQWHEKALEHIFLEITIIPYKFRAYFYEKAYWLVENINRGFRGILLIVWQILILLFILFVPYLFIVVSRKIDGVIDVQKKKSFYKSFRSSWHRFLTNFLSIFSAFAPWLLAFVALKVVESFLKISSFPELSSLVPYFYFYIYYKIFRIALEIGLQEIINFIPLKSRSGLNEKVKQTSRILGLFALLIYSIKEAFSAVLGNSLIFATIEPFFGWLTLLLLIWVSSRWKNEVQAYLQASNLVFFNKIAEFIGLPVGVFLILPALLVIVVHFVGGLLLEWTSRFEFAKVIYAKILRVKFETSRSSEGGNLKIDNEYRKLFLQGLGQMPSEHVFETDFFKTINEQVESWNQGSTNEQTVAIHGGKGSGCSSFLKQFKSSMESKSYSCHFLEIPGKTFTEKAFDSLFEEVLKSDANQKKIVFIDSAHNLFLSTIGGFEIYKQFQQIIEERKDIFWVVGFDDYSYKFLNSVLGKNQYFRIDLKLPRWPVEKIKELILGLHQSTGYKIQYDQIFRSSQKLQEETTSAENRYFYLLWEKSMGSPGLAINYWFRSLREHYGQKSLKVCLPSENPIHELSMLNQEMHFVYASLFKHENLNISEATRATHLPRSVVKQAVYRGLEEGFLEVENGRYQVNLDWIDDLRRFLKGKNLVYE